MRWSLQDLERYSEAKEYIDTTIMPLIPFQLSKDNDMIKDANKNEAISVIMNEIEKELSGRVMLLPNYYYLKTVSKTEEVGRLNDWIEDVSEQPFTHHFFITTDLSWKKYEKDLNSELLLIPGIQSGDIRTPEIASVIRDQVSQISDLIRSYW